MVIPIVKDLKIPVRFVGVGEKIEDIQEFDYENFALALFNLNDNLEQNRNNEDGESNEEN